MASSISTQVLPVHASALETVTVNSAAFDVSSIREAVLTVNVTAISGAGATLTPTVQISDDGGTTWFNLPAMTGITATGKAISAMTNFGGIMRVSWVISGTSPNITFTSNLILKSF